MVFSLVGLLIDIILGYQISKMRKQIKAGGAEVSETDLLKKLNKRRKLRAWLEDIPQLIIISIYFSYESVEFAAIKIGF